MNQDFKIQNGVLYAYNGSKEIEELIIPEGVTEIYSCKIVYTNIRSIVFPTTLMHIRSEVFCNCSRLERITFLSKKVSISDNAFAKSSLSEIINPERISAVGSYAFSETKLTHIILVNIDDLGVEAFSHCRLLQHVELSDNLRCIPHKCFYSCPSLRFIKLPKNLERISDGAFNFSPVPVIKIPDTVHEIKLLGNYATFDDSTKIEFGENHPYFQFTNNKIIKRPFHEEGGLYTIVPYDVAGRATTKRIANQNESCHLKKVLYKEEQIRKFQKLCSEYCFLVTTYDIEGNDDLDIETETLVSKTYRDISIDSMVIKDNEVIGFMCADSVIMIADVGTSVTEKSCYRSTSASCYTERKEEYLLLKR
ncbi:MAG: leucine-rich repeat domain-containing protein [Oscillospiraceae bacterium]|nr:leucine-rich repeat domain-containing protein [Oscillospiraceae bacterium]